MEGKQAEESAEKAQRNISWPWFSPQPAAPKQPEAPLAMEFSLPCKSNSGDTGEAGEIEESESDRTTEELDGVFAATLITPLIVPASTNVNPATAGSQTDSARAVPTASTLVPQGAEPDRVTEAAATRVQTSPNSRPAGEIAFAARIESLIQEKKQQADTSIKEAAKPISLARGQAPSAIRGGRSARQAETGEQRPGSEGQQMKQDVKDEASSRNRQAKTGDVEQAVSPNPKAHGPQPGMHQIPTTAAAVSTPGNSEAPRGPATTIAEPVTTIREPAAPVTLPSSPQSEISIRVGGNGQAGVDVRVVERQGSVHVAVRTHDASLSQNLRGELNDLVSRLEDRGLKTEMWAPSDATSLRVNGDREAGETRSDTRQGGSQNREDSQQQQQSGGRRDRREGGRPKWLDELETSSSSKGSSR